MDETVETLDDLPINEGVQPTQPEDAHDTKLLTKPKKTRSPAQIATTEKMQHLAKAKREAERKVKEAELEKVREKEEALKEKLKDKIVEKAVKLKAKEDGKPKMSKKQLLQLLDEVDDDEIPAPEPKAKQQPKQPPVKSIPPVKQVIFI